MWTVILAVWAVALVEDSSCTPVAATVKRGAFDGPYPPAQEAVPEISRQYGLPRWADVPERVTVGVRENLVTIPIQTTYSLPAAVPERQIQPYQRAYPVAALRTIQAQPQLERVVVPVSPRAQYGVPPLQRLAVPASPTLAYQPALPRPSYPAIPQSQPYPPVQTVEGGELSPEELDRPFTPSPQRSNLGPRPGGTGGEVSPDELEIPRNTQIKLQDKNLQYSHGFSDDKGTTFKEQGSLLSTNEGWEYVIAKKGSYSYVSPEGIPIKVNYIADHNGFKVLP